MNEQLRYLLQAQLHPFDAFYDIRFRGKGDMLLASVIVFLYGVVACLKYQYTGFVMNENPVYKMNSLSIFFSIVFLVALFCISNWSVTTLFDGKGTLESIFEVVSYSLVPLVIT